MADAIREYESRAARYFRLESVQVASGSRAGAAPPEIRALEAERLRRRLPAGMDIWSLSRGGEEIASTDLAATLSDMGTYGHPGTVFLIGGAYGLDEALLLESTRCVSLSRMTLPHDMARLMLAEQLYRAGTIIRGEPYHKGGSG